MPAEQRSIPTLIVAGTVKAGTSTLFEHLAAQPQFAPSRVKETCFFLDTRYGQPQRPVQEYELMFRARPGAMARVEATPGYFDGGKPVAEAIRRAVGNPWIVVVLREPVDRLLSFFEYKKAQLELPQSMTLAEYLRRCREMPLDERMRQENDRWWGLDGGRYADWAEDWLAVFGPTRLRFVFFDALIGDPARVVSDIQAWMGLPGPHCARLDARNANRTVPYRLRGLHALAIRTNRLLEPALRRTPRVKALVRDLYYALNGSRPATRGAEAPALAELRRFYAPYNDRLRDTLARAGVAELPDWLSGAR
jgi:hypothetical protein